MFNFILGWLCGWAALGLAAIVVAHYADKEYNAGKVIEQKHENLKRIIPPLRSYGDVYP